MRLCDHIRNVQTQSNAVRGRFGKFCLFDQLNQWLKNLLERFGWNERSKKAPIGVDADSSLGHTVSRTSGNVNDVVEGNALLRSEAETAFRDAGYWGIDKRADANAKVQWRIALITAKNTTTN